MSEVKFDFMAFDQFRQAHRVEHKAYPTDVDCARWQFDQLKSVIEGLEKKLLTYETTPALPDHGLKTWYERAKELEAVIEEKDREIEKLKNHLSLLRKDAEHYFERVGHRQPTTSYSIGRWDTYHWVKECVDEALGVENGKG